MGQLHLDVADKVRLSSLLDELQTRLRFLHRELTVAEVTDEPEAKAECLQRALIAAESVHTSIDSLHADVNNATTYHQLV